MRRELILVLAVVAVVVSASYGDIYFQDGGTHNIDYTINETVWIDYQTPGIGTTVNVLPSATVRNVYAYAESQVTVAGGSVRSVLYPGGGKLRAYDHSQVTISGGYIGDDILLWHSSQVDFLNGSVFNHIGAHHESQLTVSGGYIGADLYALDDSQIDFSGGSVGTDLKVFERSQVDFSGGFVDNDLLADSSGILRIYGSGFRVDGQPFGYGELTSIGGGANPMGPPRHLWGILANGDLLDNDFYIGHDAKIVLAVPIPSAVVLGSMGLSLAGWLCRRKTRRSGERK